MVSIKDEDNTKIAIKEVNKIEILSLTDNSVDYLSSNDQPIVKPFRQWTKERYNKEWHSTHTQMPFAEHGFSMLLKVATKTAKFIVLFDTGVSSDGLIENAKRMGIDLKEINYIVLSHGHYDHFGGLINVLKTVNKADLPLIIHEGMFKQRGSISSKGEVRAHPPFPPSQQLKPAKTLSTTLPLLIEDGSACVTGEIPRTTMFEKGSPQNVTLKGKVWQPDPLIIDERALILNLKDYGLIILSGCAHAGIINTISYAKKLSGINKIYAVIGGFHLAGKENQKRIMPTIKQLKQLNPKIIIPTHCTGWQATMQIAQKLPQNYIHNSVGNIYQLNC